MNKVELIEKVAQDVCMPKSSVQKVLDSVLEAVRTTVVAGETVTLVGFGTFESRKRNARTCRNPQTGDTMNVEAKTVPYFKAGKKFKEIVNA